MNIQNWNVNNLIIKNNGFLKMNPKSFMCILENGSDLYRNPEWEKKNAKKNKYYPFH